MGASSTIEVICAVNQVLTAIFKSGFEYKKAGVIMGGIASATVSASPLSLFPDEEAEQTNERQQKLMLVMVKINRQYGNGMIHTGAENSEAWKPQQTHRLPQYTTDWKVIIEVRGN